MYAFLRFPNFRTKAVTLSYDDGVIFDKKLIEIFNKNGLKATFNLNSGGYGIYGKLSKEEAVLLYKNSRHEIAVHGEAHYSLAEISDATATWDVLADRRDHEETYGVIVRGMAYANGSYNDKIKETLKSCGIVYARTTEATRSFDIPNDWLMWNPTCHHKDEKFDELIDRFLHSSSFCWERQEAPRIFYLWGHSYEFNNDNNWEIIEDFAKRVGNRADIWYATNIEVYEYVKAYDSLIYSVNGTRVKNPTATDVWICYYGKEVFVPAGKEVKFYDINDI